MVFFSTPDGVGMVQAPAELAKGARVIDYSGDFRFNNVEDYAEYARRIGIDSVDGTYLTFGPSTNLPKLLGWVSGASQGLLGEWSA